MKLPTPLTALFVTNSDLLACVPNAQQAFDDNEIDGVTTGDTDRALILVKTYKENVLPDFSDDLTEDENVALLVVLDGLPEGTYIDMEN